MYRKKTFTGCFLNFQSNCSFKKKVNLVRASCHRAHKIFFSELLLSEIKQIKLLLNKNVYLQKLVNKTIHLHLKNLDRIKTLGPEKCVVTLKIPIINKSSEMLKKKIRRLVRNTYYAANPRIVFISKPLLTPGGKDPISNLNKCMVIYQYSCCCKASYVGLTTRHLRKRIKEHVPKSVENFCFSDKKDDRYTGQSFKCI